MIEKDAMKEALKRKRNGGVSLTIVLGDGMEEGKEEAKEEKEAKDLGLAPEVKDLKEGQEALMQHEMQEGEMDEDGGLMGKTGLQKAGLKLKNKYK